MAVRKSGKSGSNVTNLEEARIKRSGARPPDKVDSIAPNTQSLEDSSLCDDSTHIQVEMKANGRSRISNRRFDKAKVDRIKAEIARGEYQIDYFQVADKFIEHERYG